MKKIIVVLFCLLVFLSIVLVIRLSVNVSEEPTEINNPTKETLTLEETEPKKIGYCLTMKEDVFAFVEDKNIEPILFSSSGEVLEKLRLKEIDYGMIGRKARINEINKNIQKEVLRSGYTLVFKIDGGVDISQLNLIEINTYLDEHVVDSFNLEHVTYYDNLKEAIEDGFVKNKPVLISWEDWNDDYRLVTVFDNDKKVKDFRGVFLYSYS